jgi:hypothetical protein
MFWTLSWFMSISVRKIQSVCVIELMQDMILHTYLVGGRHDRDRMVVGFIPTCAISTYHHWSCQFDTHYVIKFASNLRQVFSGYSGFLHQYYWPPRYNWILLTVALSTINQTKFSITWYYNGSWITLIVSEQGHKLIACDSNSMHINSC